METLIQFCQEYSDQILAVFLIGLMVFTFWNYNVDSPRPQEDDPDTFMKGIDE